jgi:hypothetical protein
MKMNSLMETLRVNNNPNIYVNDNLEIAYDTINKNLLKVFIDSEIIRSKGRQQNFCYYFNLI